MTIDARQWQVFVDGIIFHQFDCLSNPQLVLNLLDAVPIAFEGISFDREIIANRVSDRFRQRRLKSIVRNWTKVRAELLQGSISTLYFDTTAKGYASVAFQMFNVLNSRSGEYPSEGYDSVSFLLADKLIKEQLVDLNKCISFLQQAWELLNGVYGFLDVFVSNQRGSMLPHVVQKASIYFRAKSYNGFVDSPNAMLHTQIPDAYWGNFLNANHASAIGGLDQIRSRLPQAIMLPLAHDGMFVQIAPSPLYDRYDDWLSDHNELEQVLASILKK